jgi:hypothetical protein
MKMKKECSSGAERWVCVTEASRLLGCTDTSVRRLAAAGKLTVKAIPGARPMYPVSELQAIADQSVKKATSGAFD